MAKRKTLKQIAKAKAKAELKEIKERIKDKKNPFNKYMKVLDNTDKFTDLAINLALAYQSVQIFGKSEYEVSEIIKVPYQVWVWDEGPKWVPYPTLPGPQIEGPSNWEGGSGHWETKYREEYKVSKKTAYNPLTAVIGPIALKLAKSDNLAGGIVGTGTLATMGLITGINGITSLIGAGSASEWLTFPSVLPSILNLTSGIGSIINAGLVGAT